MNMREIIPGEQYVYYPKKEDELDNRHFPAVVESIGRTVRARIYSEEHPLGVVRSVSAKRLFKQADLVGIA